MDLPPREPTEEELRLGSSDLSDCEEVWIQELSHYYLETQKRQRQVELWFEDSCVVRIITMQRNFQAIIHSMNRLGTMK